MKLRETEIIRLLLKNGEKLTNMLIPTKHNNTDKYLIAKVSDYYKKIFSESIQTDFPQNISYKKSTKIIKSNISQITTKLVPCFMCNLQFDQIKLYNRHLRGHKNRDKSNATADNVNKELLRIKEIKNHKCNSCLKEYKCIDSAKSHATTCATIIEKKIPTSSTDFYKKMSC
jgi:hypothetical protein